MTPSAPDATSPLRLLVLTNMWPTARDPVFGSFVARHVGAMRDAGASVRVVANTDSRTGGAAAARKYASLAARGWWAAAAGRGRYDAVVGHYLYPTAAIAHRVARPSCWSPTVPTPAPCCATTGSDGPGAPRWPTPRSS